MFDAMYRQETGKEMKGFFAWGQNPACSSANTNKIRQALAKLDWLVTVNPYSTETSEFWYGPGMSSASINTEVYRFPCRASMEKEGSVTNSGRWAQWRYAADVDLPEDVKGDAEIMNDLYVAVRALYVAEGGQFTDPILNLKWDYFGGSEVPARLLAKEINGYYVADVTETNADGSTTEHKAGDLVASFAKLLSDGTTSSGNWLYCNSYVDHDFATGNKMARRTASDPATDVIGLNAEWAWCWPVNRRIVYNRASVDLAGQPWDATHPVIAWDGTTWVGDVPDGGWPPMDQGEASRLPFIMQPDGVGKVFANPHGVGNQRRTCPRALRADRIAAGFQPAWAQPAGKPGDDILHQRSGPAGCPREQRVPDHLLDVPGGRALADRGDDPLGALAERASAGDVRGNVRGLSDREGHLQRRTGESQKHPRGGTGGGDCHQAVQAVHDSRSDGPPGWYTLVLRLGCAQR